MKNRQHETEALSSRPFEKLKEIIDVRGLVKHSSGPEPREKEAVPDEEIFIEAMRKVREIKEFRSMPVLDKKVSLPKRGNENSAGEPLRTLKAITEGKEKINLAHTQEYVEWVNPDYSSIVTAKLHRGNYSIQDFIDLHGYTVEEADVEIDKFIKSVLKRGFCCVKIIHGRGLRSSRGPVLKESVIGWLKGRYRKNTIAFVTARQCDGGLGAVYVLLKRKQII